VCWKADDGTGFRAESHRRGRRLRVVTGWLCLGTSVDSCLRARYAATGLGGAYVMENRFRQSGREARSSLSHATSALRVHPSSSVSNVTPHPPSSLRHGIGQRREARFGSLSRLRRWSLRIVCDRRVEHGRRADTHGPLPADSLPGKPSGAQSILIQRSSLDTVRILMDTHQLFLSICE
jgi:hypothetical protein